jgi:hypothetical protein
MILLHLAIFTPTNSHNSIVRNIQSSYYVFDTIGENYILRTCHSKRSENLCSNASELETLIYIS